MPRWRDWCLRTLFSYSLLLILLVYALCTLDFALPALYPGLCTTCFERVLCTVCFVLCFVLCALYFVLCTVCFVNALPSVICALYCDLCFVLCACLILVMWNCHLDFYLCSYIFLFFPVHMFSAFVFCLLFVLFLPCLVLFLPCLVLYNNITL